MHKPQFGSISLGFVRLALQALVLTAVFVFCGALQGDVQRTSSTYPGDQFGLSDPALEHKRLRAVNADRQKSLVTDSEKLLKLAHALNDEIEKTHPDSLTPSQLHTVAEIEKLAHGVKEKMSYSYMGGPLLREPSRFPGGVR
jgi:hypothetical protein